MNRSLPLPWVVLIQQDADSHTWKWSLTLVVELTFLNIGMLYVLVFAWLLLRDSPEELIYVVNPRVGHLRLSREPFAS